MFTLRWSAWLLVAVAGCAYVNSRGRDADLRDIGLAYQNYYMQSGRGPRNLDDLRSSLRPELVRGIESGEYVVIWNQKLPPGIGPRIGEHAGRILVYEKGTPERGGRVCTGSGMLRTVTPEEFRLFTGTEPAK